MLKLKKKKKIVRESDFGRKILSSKSHHISKEKFCTITRFSKFLSVCSWWQNRTSLNDYPIHKMSWQILRHQHCIARGKIVFPRELATYGKCSKFHLFRGIEGEQFHVCVISTYSLSAKKSHQFYLHNVFRIKMFFTSTMHKPPWSLTQILQ